MREGIINNANICSKCKIKNRCTSCGSIDVAALQDVESNPGSCGDPDCCGANNIRDMIYCFDCKESQVLDYEM
jgi:hypothetical protein